MVKVIRQYLDPLSFPNTTPGNPSCRVLFRINKGQKVIPTSIKCVNFGFNCVNGQNRLNGQRGVWECVSRVEIRNGLTGELLQECRNVAQFMEVLNTMGMTNAKADGIRAYESGNAVALSIDNSSGLQSMRHAMANRLTLDNNYFGLTFEKVLPILSAMPEVIDCGVDLLIEFGNAFKFAPGATISGIVLQFDEVVDAPSMKTSGKFVYTEILPERLYIPSGPNAGVLNINNYRFLTFSDRAVDKLLLNIHRVTDDVPHILENQALNLFLGGSQFVSLTGMTGGGMQQRLLSGHLGGMVYPYNHLIIPGTTEPTDSTPQSATQYIADDPSVADVLKPNSADTGSLQTGNHVLNALCFNMEGLRCEDLILQIQAKQSDDSTSYPDLYCYMFGQVLKEGVLDEGKFKSQYL